MQITIFGELTDLNTYINAERSNKFIGAKIKKDNTNLALSQLTLKEVVRNYPVQIVFTWYTKNTRKDPDNVSFCKKYLLDALVAKGILEGDTRKHIKGFRDIFEVDSKNPRVVIDLSTV